MNFQDFKNLNSEINREKRTLISLVSNLDEFDKSNNSHPSLRYYNRIGLSTKVNEQNCKIRELEMLRSSYVSIRVFTTGIIIAIIAALIQNCFK